MVPFYKEASQNLGSNWLLGTTLKHDLGETQVKFSTSQEAYQAKAYLRLVSFSPILNKELEKGKLMAVLNSWK